MGDSDYQLIIVGGGPAGLTAGLYASRAKLKTVLLEKGATGGQVMLTDWIDNYPGFPEGISGFDLADKMAAQAKRFGLETRSNTIVTRMDLKTGTKKIFLEDGSHLTCKSLIIATGARPSELKVPGEIEFAGKGVSYCATCDAPFYRDQEVVVVGGGNTAIQEAIYLTKFARKVKVIHRREQLRATQIIQDQALANEKIEFILNSTVTEISGAKGVEKILLKNTAGAESIIPAQGIFILIGTNPNNEMLPLDQIETKEGFVITDREMRTNIPGVMAAGDICYKSVRQVVNAAGEGAVAAMAAEHHLAAPQKK
ncbi:MAG: thioredoxin-disulfide reductase [Proteobacteria bacterium]|nr:thioredoxin-disulfide reductase [Pseudomonadota bacterium]MBU1716586.1 thioredoxin-disulfide reductase [Pseudomonadota bacterium]